MRTIRIKLYKFSELNEDAKQKAIEHLWDINVDSEHWYSGIMDDAENIGLKITDSDEQYVKGEFTLAANEVAANIFRDHGETCETYKTAQSFMAEWQPIFDKYMDTEDGEDKLMDIEDEFRKSLCEDYRIMFSKEYEYMTSKQAIIETIEANEYEFTKDGKLS